MYEVSPNLRIWPSRYVPSAPQNVFHPKSMITREHIKGVCVNQLIDLLTHPKNSSPVSKLQKNELSPRPGCTQFSCILPRPIELRHYVLSDDFVESRLRVVLDQVLVGRQSFLLGVCFCTDWFSLLKLELLDIVLLVCSLLRLLYQLTLV